MHSKKNHSFFKRLTYAANGVVAAWKRDASIRTQIVVTCGLILFCLVAKPPVFWCAVFAVVAALVLALEMVNSALEAVLDKLHPDLDTEIGFAKDCLAGAVLVASITAVLVFGFYLFFVTKQ